jgi:hypothetical protein
MHRACCTADKTFVFEYLGKLMWISTNIKIKLIGQDILLCLADIHIICNNNIYKLWTWYQNDIHAMVGLWCFTSLSAIFQLHYGCSYDVTTQVREHDLFSLLRVTTLQGDEPHWCNMKYIINAIFHLTSAYIIYTFTSWFFL